MLQSEFFERTHITLTGEEYADVECLYDAVKMHKDEFCKCWVSERKNPLFQELAEAYCHDTSQMQTTCESLRKEYDEYRESMTKAREKFAEKYENMMKEFASRIVRANAMCDENLIRDIIEEEFGLDFIIRTKFSADIPLSKDEIAYMVGML